MIANNLLRRVLCVTLVLGLASAALAQDAAAPDPTLDQYYNANSLFNSKLFKLAASEYEAFLKAHPTHAKASMARYGLALSYYNQGLYKEATPLLTQLAGDANFPFRAYVQNRLGASLLALNDNEKAEKAFAFAAANSVDPAGKEEGLVGLVVAQSRLGKWTDVITHSAATLKLAPQSIHAERMNFLAGVAQFELKKYPAAAQIFQALLAAKKDTPFHHHATFLLAECLREANDLPGAAKLYAAAQVQKGTYSEEAAYRLGVVQFTQGQWAPAIKQLAAFVQAYPKSTYAPQASLHLGRAYLEAKQFPAAAQTLTPLTGVAKVAASATLWLAKTNAAQKNFAAVEAALVPAVARFSADPLLAELYYELANAQRELQKYEPAAASFAQAAAAGKDRPLAPAATYLQGFCLHKAAKYAPSLALSVSFLKAWPKHELTEEVQFLQAENLMLLGKLDEALAAYQAFAKAWPKSGHINICHMRMGEAYHQQKKWANVLMAVDPLLKAQIKDPGFERLWFLAGDSHFRLAAADKAVIALKRFLAEQPKDPVADAAMFNLAMAYKQTKQDAQAIATWTRLVATFPKSSQMVPSAVALGREYYATEKYAQARTALAPAVAVGDPDALYLMGWVELAEKKDPAAAQFFATLQTKHPKHPLVFDAVLQQAAVAVRAKNYLAAEQKLTALVAAQPKHEKLDQALFYLGRAQARQSKWAPASLQFTRVVTEFPKSPVADQAMYELAWCDKGAGKNDQAAKRYATFLTTYPQSPWVQDVAFELSELEFEAKQYDPAIVRLKELAKSARKDLAGKVMYRLAWCHFEKGQTREAAESFEAALKEQIDPSIRSLALYQAGESRLRLKEYESATKHFAAAVAAADAKILEQAMLRLGECQGMISQWPQSLQTYTTFLGKYPKSAHVLRAKFGLGWAQENLKQYPQAIGTYRQVVAAGKRNETSARCQFQIGECLFAQQKMDEAIKELTLADTKYNLPKWSSKATLEVGRVLEVQKKNAEAIVKFEEVVKRFAGTDEAAIAGKKLVALKAALPK